LKHIQIDTSVLWFHCASLGEWEQAIPIVDNLKQQGDFSIILSFYSSSGFVHAKRLDLVDWVFYLEVDFRHYHEEIFNKFKSGLFYQI
jgi:3-deoxy-D-manno-octulosonic-acid transferase